MRNENRRRDFKKTQDQIPHQHFGIDNHMRLTCPKQKTKKSCFLSFHFIFVSLFFILGSSNTVGKLECFPLNFRHLCNRKWKFQ